MTISKRQSDLIQILRGGAIIAVVLIHNTPPGLWQVWCRPLLNFSVGLFLFLSGLLSNIENYKPMKRISKVLYPYIFWTFIYTIIGNIRNASILPFMFLKNLITGGSAAIMYFIFVYCELTILIPFIDRLAKSKYRNMGFSISFIEIIFMRLIPLIIGYKFNSYINVLMSISCIGWFIYFYLGYLVGNRLVNVDLSKVQSILLLFFSIIFQIFEGFIYFRLGSDNCGTQLKVSSIITGVIFCIICFNMIKKDTDIRLNFLKVLGDNSFGIYFIHLAIMGVLNKVPYYSQYCIYPFNGIVVVFISFIGILISRKYLKSKSKYFGF